MHIPIYSFNKNFLMAGDIAVCDRFLFDSTFDVHEVKYSQVVDNVFNSFFLQKLALLTVLNLNSFTFYILDLNLAIVNTDF